MDQKLLRRRVEQRLSDNVPPPRDTNQFFFEKPFKNLARFGSADGAHFSISGRLLVGDDRKRFNRRGRQLAEVLGLEKILHENSVGRPGDELKALRDTAHLDPQRHTAVKRLEPFKNVQNP